MTNQYNLLKVEALAPILTEMDTKVQAAKDSADKAELFDGPQFDTLHDMLASTLTGFAVDTIIGVREGGFRYRVRPGGSTDFQLTSAGGTLYRVLPTEAGHYNFACMNPAADGVTDDWAKLIALIDVERTGTPSYVSGPSIFFPSANYYIGQTIELKASVHLWGRASGLQTDSPAKLIFPENSGGIVVNRYNTINNTVEAVPTTAADASIIEGLYLQGGGGDNVFGHGIWARGRCVIRNVRSWGFSGCGIAVWAASNGLGTHTPTSGDPQGNANLTWVSTVSLRYNGVDGLRVDGYDANAGYFEAVDSGGNSRYGIRDSSFLGNTYVACHTVGNGVANNGFNAADSSSFVTFGGRRYSAHPDATETELSATEPGTDETVWVDSGSGGTHSTIPLWVSGKPVGTYFNGGAYMCDNANARNVFIGCYSESGASGSSFAGPCLVLGGAIGLVVKGSVVQGTDGGKITAKGFSSDTSPVTVSVAGNEGNNEVLSFADEEDVFRIKRSGADWVLNNKNLNSRIAFTIHGGNTALNCGTSEAKPYIMSFPVLGVGKYGNVRRQTTGNAAPAGNTWGKGDIVWSVAAAAAGKCGWICTTAGTAGSTAVFKPFGAIDA